LKNCHLSTNPVKKAEKNVEKTIEMKYIR